MLHSGGGRDLGAAALWAREAPADGGVCIGERCGWPPAVDAGVPAWLVISGAAGAACELLSGKSRGFVL
jgi:hypothetical protein